MPDRTKAACEWFEKGKHDLEGAQILFESGHYTDTTAILIQQAVEKYLKGFLIRYGWKLEKIHDLVRLLTEAAKYKPELAKFEEDCRRITEYYFESRYPGENCGVTMKTVGSSLAMTHLIWVKSAYVKAVAHRI